MKAILVLAWVLANAAVGCATIGWTDDVANRYYIDQHFQPKAVDQVEVLSVAPQRPYEVIADFQSRGDTPVSLRKKAADIGADAIIVRELGGEVSNGAEWASDANPHLNYTRIVGTAIRFK